VTSGRRIGLIFLGGSLVTIGLALWLLEARHPLAAIGVLEVSPFPCPPGLPC
jgi:hypothetical protein